MDRAAGAIKRTSSQVHSSKLSKLLKQVLWVSEAGGWAVTPGTVAMTQITKHKYFVIFN